MPLLGHWPELLGVLLIGLLVFGPRRMIEMGSTLGKAVREMRESLKDIPGLNGSGMQGLLGHDEPQRTPFIASSQMPPTPVAAPAPTLTAASTTPSAAQAPTNRPTLPSAEAEVVDGTVERVVDVSDE